MSQRHFKYYKNICQQHGILQINTLFCNFFVFFFNVMYDANKQTGMEVVIAMVDDCNIK